MDGDLISRSDAIAILQARADMAMGIPAVGTIAVLTYPTSVGTAAGSRRGSMIRSNVYGGGK